jgi:hypothetical protein
MREQSTGEHQEGIGSARSGKNASRKKVSMALYEHLRDK